MLSDVFVPLLTFPDDATPTALPRLSSLIEQFAVHVTYCGVEIDVPDLADRWGGALIALPQMVADVEQRSRQNATNLLSGVELLSERLTTDRSKIRAAFGDPGQAVAQRARHYDLTAMTMRDGSAEHSTLAEDLIFGSGRPLLIVPDRQSPSTGLSRIAVAWDGSPTASRALYDAMSLITEAEDLAILTAHRDKPVPQSALDATLAYLQRHGVKARVVSVATDNKGIGDALQDAAMGEYADLLVMGAYGHSRLREFILGGATAAVLKAPVLPVFFSR